MKTNGSGVTVNELLKKYIINCAIRAMFCRTADALWTRDCHDSQNILFPEGTVNTYFIKLVKISLHYNQ